MKGRIVFAVLALTAACAILRSPGLRAHPIFGDEAIHLHWAQLIRELPVENAFVSLQDPKPPLHFWLLAVFLSLAPDPVFAGRLLSLVAGALSVPLLFAAARALFRRVDSSAPELEALAGCALFVLSPFFAFYQRLALAESLFTLETLLVVWLSLRLASACLDGSPWLPRAASLGIAMGAAMLTRQDFSYVLWALPPLAWWVLASRGRREWMPFLGGLFVSALIAFLLWAPMLLARTGPDWRTRVFHVGHYREAISLAQRGRNALQVLGWFATYLTPPVLAAAVLAFLVLLLRRRRAGLFLGGWLALVVGSPLVFASLFFPRYFVGGAIPLLILAGWLAAELLRRLFTRGWPVAARAAGAALALGFVAWPVLDLVRPWIDWKQTTLVPIDRWQYVTGWPAGAATEAAAQFVIARARARPVLLLTPEISGNPTDGLWVLLAHRDRIVLRGTPDSIDRPILVASRQTPGQFLLRGDIREMKPPRDESLPPDAEVDFVCPDPVVTRQGSFATESYLRERNPELRLLARFENPRDPASPQAAAVLVFQLR